MTTRYLNTDLDIIGECDIRPLVATLEAQEFLSLHCEQAESGRWHATLEKSISDDQPDGSSPEESITAMFPALEALTGEPKSIWERCSERCLDMGFECGEEPWGFRQELSTNTLTRIAALGMTLRITLYPVRQ
jgi:hypothetical protein